MTIDLRQASYHEFIEFVFNHYPEDQPSNKWYRREKLEIVIDPRTAIAYLTLVCKRSHEIVRRFTVRQVAEGINFLFGAGGGEWFRDELWNPDVPWADRQDCILSIPLLYADLFERHDDGGLGFMLWDSITYDYFCGNRDPVDNTEDARVQSAMLAALTVMLDSENPDTQAAALHGLGHLSHAQGNRVIRDFIGSSRKIDPRVRHYGAQVLEGNFQ